MLPTVYGLKICGVERFSCFEVAPGNGFICAFPEFKYLLNSHILMYLGMLSDKMVVLFPCSMILLYELFPGTVVVLLHLKRFWFSGW